jgi:hypothetical protein
VGFLLLHCNLSCNSHDRVGIDFKGVQMVINYDLPQTAVAYIHRIGKPCCGTVVLCVRGGVIGMTVAQLSINSDL